MSLSLALFEGGRKFRVLAAITMGVCVLCLGAGIPSLWEVGSAALGLSGEQARLEETANSFQRVEDLRQEKAVELRKLVAQFDFLISKTAQGEGRNSAAATRLAEAWSAPRESLLIAGRGESEGQAKGSQHQLERIGAALTAYAEGAVLARDQALAAEMGRGLESLRALTAQMRILAGLRTTTWNSLRENVLGPAGANARIQKALRRAQLFQGVALILTLGGGVLGWMLLRSPLSPKVAELIALARSNAYAMTKKRARERGTGPLRELSVAFNQMLEAQQEAENRLQKAQASLEIQVAARTAELWRANTALKTESEQRARTEHELYQSQKMDALGKLAGSIAHDFNNLLGVIIGGAESTANQLPPNHSAQHLVKMIQNAGERAAELTRPLLAFSRNQVLPVELRDVNASAEETAMMLRRLLGVNIDLRLTLAPELPALQANGSQLSQVLMNLGVNARDAMEGMGILNISTGVADVPAERAEAKGVAGAERWVEIRVSDTGTGMDATTKARIFEPFFTTKPVGKGTGLGLSTVFGIVKQLSGFVEVESELGLGSTFSVFLPALSAVEERRLAARTPAVQAPALAPADAAPVLTAAPLEDRQTILVVDDEEDLLELATLTLESKGYRVLAAPSAAEAILLVEQHRHDIRAVVTDVMMPEITGVQLAEILAKMIPTVRVLFVSGHSNEVISPAGLQTWEAEYLQKPYRGEALAQKVQEVLKAGARRDPEEVLALGLN